MSERPVLRLRFLHQRLEREIDQERGRRLPDDFRLIRLKKLKLAIKDRLAKQGTPRPTHA